MMMSLTPDDPEQPSTPAADCNSVPEHPSTPTADLDSCAENAFVTRPTRPRLTAYAPPPASSIAEGESSPPTLPLAKVRVLRPKSADGLADPNAPTADGPPDFARMFSTIAAVAPAGPQELTLPVGRKTTTTPNAPSAPIPRPRLLVLRGMKVDREYPIYEGPNLIGRHDDQPVDIDLNDQEPADRIWTSRHHAVLTYENGVLMIEDLHSLNGTFVNRHQLFPGQKRTLSANDVLQIGTIQLRVTI
jgi:hypothetical protein